MPDVFTHLMVGMSIALLVRRNDYRPDQMLIILGAVLIDAERPITWLLAGTPLYWLDLYSAFHSVLGAIIISYSAASCIQSQRTAFLERFRLILLGSISHLLLDMTMNPWEEIGVYLLYPLRIPFSFGFFWSDFWLYPLFGVAAVAVTLTLKHALEFFIDKNDYGKQS